MGHLYSKADKNKTQTMGDRAKLFGVAASSITAVCLMVLAILFALKARNAANQSERSVYTQVDTSGLPVVNYQPPQGHTF